MKADVVVVGGGGSGLAAAIGAREQGADVVLLEKNPYCGGTTARSIGSITATRTAHQARAGITDTPDEHYEDMPGFAKHVSRPDNDELRRILVDNVPETFRWLCDMGVEFYGPLEEPPNKKPRMHNVVPNSRAYIYHLERRARKIGVRIVNEARASGLIRAQGTVTGIRYKDAGGTEHEISAPAVVLAAGDYAADPDMKLRYISEAVARTDPINPTSTGDGIRLGLEAGGEIINGDLFGGGIRFSVPKANWISKLPPSPWIMKPTGFALRYMPMGLVRKFVMGFLTTVLVPDLRLFEQGAILVNRRGARFADETKHMVFSLADQPDGMAHIVFDTDVAERFSKWPYYLSTAPGFAYAYIQDYVRNRPDLVIKADTIDELATKVGVPVDALTANVKTYNDGAEGVLARGSRPQIRRAPFYALGPVRNYINYTDGGLRVNEHLQVLRSDGTPVKGLFAAGSNGQGGLLLKGHGHHLGWAFTSGRMAGRNAAQRYGLD